MERRELTNIRIYRLILYKISLKDRNRSIQEVQRHGLNVGRAKAALGLSQCTGAISQPMNLKLGRDMLYLLRIGSVIRTIVCVGLLSNTMELA